MNIRYTRTLIMKGLMALGFLSLGVGCSEFAQKNDPQYPPKIAQTDFISANVSANNSRDMAQADAGAASPNTSPTRTVEEGDIFKLDGNTLYVLNQYRGLQIIDVTNADAPVLKGTSKILGHPVEMYIKDGFAYIIVSDYFTYWQQADGTATPFNGSQVRIVDVRNATTPLVVGGINLDGAVQESRIVGEVLYTVSNRYAWYTNGASTDNTNALVVTSINFSNRAAPRQVQTISFNGTGQYLHVSPTSLYVGTTQYDQTNWRLSSTNITVVDINDPAGAIVTRASLSVPGQMQNRFNFDEYQNMLRIVTHSGGWDSSGSQHLTVFDLTRGQEQKLSELPLPNTGGLFATRFDGTRAYVTTMVSVDPLEVIDLSNPRVPVLTHSLEIPGVLNQIVARGDRLLALGTDTRWSGVAASLFDVANPQAPKLLSRVKVGNEGDSYAWSNANWDDKALRVLDDKNMMLVPFNAYQQSDGCRDATKGVCTSKYVNGFQILSFDRTTITPHGIVEQDGSVERTTANATRLFSISDRSLQTVDATNLDQPKITAKLELARDMGDFVIIGNNALSLSYSGYYWDAQNVSIRVTAANNPEGAIIGSLALPFRGSKLLSNGTDLVVVGWGQNNDVHAAKISIANPATPVLVSEATFTNTYTNNEYVSFYADNGILVDANTVAFPGWGSRSVNGVYSNYSPVGILNLATNAFSKVELEGTTSGDLFVANNQIWTSHQEYIPTTNTQGYSRFYADRIALGSTPTVLPKISIPGSLLGLHNNGQTLYTRDYQWDAQNHITHSLAELTVSGDVATLRAYIQSNNSLGRILVKGDHLYATTGQWWWYANSTGNTIETYATTSTTPLKLVSSVSFTGYQQLRDVLGNYLILGSGYYGGPWECGDFGGGFRGGFAGDYAGYYSGNSNSLLIYSLQNKDLPTYHSFVRTEGWVQGLTLFGNTLSVASGMYGVQQIELATTTPVP